MKNEKKSFLFGYFQIVYWFLAWAIFSYISALGVNVMRDALAEYRGLSNTVLLDATSAGGWVGCVLFLFVPYFFRRIGAKWVLVITGTLTGICFILMPMFSSAVAVGICFGGSFALSAIFVVCCTLQLVGNWFPRKKGIVMGAITSGGILAGLVFLPIINSLIAAYSIVTALVVLGGFVVLYSLAAIFCLKERAEDAGLMPDNMPPDGRLRELYQERGISSKEAWATVLKSRPVWFIGIGWGLGLLATLGFLAIAVSYMLSRGVPMPQAMLAMTFVGVAQFAVSFISGGIDQKFSPRASGTIFLGIQLIGFLICAFYFGSSIALVILSVYLIIASFDAYNNIYGSQLLTCYGKYFPEAFNLMSFITAIIKTFGTFVAARSLSMTGAYVGAYRVYTIAIIVAVMMVWLGGNTLIKAARPIETTEK